jgi:hypothetical protein
MMKRVCVYSLGLLVALAGLANAALTPVQGSNYTITFERTGWSATLLMMVPVTATWDQTPTGGLMTPSLASMTYMQDLGTIYNRPGVLDEITWYVNSPQTLAENSTDALLPGTGPLTIRVEGLQFTNTSSDLIAFLPGVTHIYYVDVNYDPMALPDDEPVNPGTIQRQQSPIVPLTPAAADYAVYGSAYGMPVQISPYSTTSVSFELPALYVPDDMGQERIWELSFGAGFGTVIVPEPMTLLTVAGVMGAWLVRRRTAA